MFILSSCGMSQTEWKLHGQKRSSSCSTKIFISPPCWLPQLLFDFLLRLYLLLFTRPLSGVESISGSSVCLSICLSSLLIQTLSSRNITQSTLITQPLSRYLSSPIHVSHVRQSTGLPSQSIGPPINIFIWGRVMCQLDIFWN